MRKTIFSIFAVSFILLLSFHLLSLPVQASEKTYIASGKHAKQKYPFAGGASCCSCRTVHSGKLPADFNMTQVGSVTFYLVGSRSNSHYQRIKSGPTKLKLTLGNRSVVATSQLVSPGASLPVKVPWLITFNFDPPVKTGPSTAWKLEDGDNNLLSAVLLHNSDVDQKGLPGVDVQSGCQYNHKVNSWYSVKFESGPSPRPEPKPDPKPDPKPVPPPVPPGPGLEIVEVRNQEFQIRLSGKKIYETFAIQFGIIKSYQNLDGYNVDILSELSGGNICQATKCRVIRWRPDGTHMVSDAFGNCTGPKISVTNNIVYFFFDEYMGRDYTREGFANKKFPAQYWNYSAGKLSKFSGPIPDPDPDKPDPEKPDPIPIQIQLLSPKPGATLPQRNHPSDPSGFVWEFKWDVARSPLSILKYQILIKHPEIKDRIFDTENKRTTYLYRSNTPINNNILHGWTWQVRANLGENRWSDWSEIGKFSVAMLDITPPTAPQLTAPSHNTTLTQLNGTDSSCQDGFEWRFQWKPAQDKEGGIAKYKIFIKQRNQPDPMVEDIVTDTSYIYKSCQPLDDSQLLGWSWQVQAQDDQGNWGELSDEWDFEVESIFPTTPVLTVPVIDAVLERGNNPDCEAGVVWKFGWEDVTHSNGIKGYQIIITTPGPDKSLVIADEYVNDSEFTFSYCNPLDENYLSNWEWVVKAQNNAGHWSKTTGSGVFSVAEAPPGPDPISLAVWEIEVVQTMSGEGRDISLDINSQGNPAIGYSDSSNFDVRYTYFNGTTWDIDTVDTGGNVGSNLSLGYGSSGNPGISYYDATNQDLRYAYFDGSNWNVSILDLWGDVGFSNSLAFDSQGYPAICYCDKTNGDLKFARFGGTNWSIARIDTQGNVAFHTSLAFDSQGNPGIAYSDETNQSLKYAHFNGTTWDIEVVTQFYPSYTSLAFDSQGYPAISYYDQTNGDLKFAHFNGTAWNIEDVDTTGDVGSHNSLAYDNQGNPAISYYDSTNLDLKYAYHDGASWVIEVVEAEGNAGWLTSLEFDILGNPCIGYHHISEGNLKFARKTIIAAQPPDQPVNISPSDGITDEMLETKLTASAFSDPDNDGHTASQWQVTSTSGDYSSPVFDSGEDATNLTQVKLPKDSLECATTYYRQVRYKDSKGLWSQWSEETSFTTLPYISNWNIELVNTGGDVRYSISLAFDAQGRPGVAYFDLAAKQLKYTAFNGTTWNLETVDTPGDFCESLFLNYDPQGYPAISYYDDTNQDLKYASYNGTTWNKETVDSPGNVGQFCSLTFSPSGHPAISYYDASNHKIKYAHFNGSTWDKENVSAALISGVFWKTSLAFDSQGNPAISYPRADEDTWDVGSVVHDVYYAFYNGVSWNTEKIDSIGQFFDMGCSLSLAFNGQGNPAVSYYEGGGGNLKYALSDGSTWNIQTVDTTNDVGYHNSLAFDKLGHAAISYCDISYHNLKYAYYNGSAWEIETVDTDDEVGDINSLALDPRGNPAIAYSYFDGQTSKLKFSRKGTAIAPPNKPVNVSPGNGAIDIDTIDPAPELTASTFVDSDGDSHAASQWQVREETGSYTSPVFNSQEDTTNLTHKTLPSVLLECSIAYLWRVRYKDDLGIWSEWSAETVFTTVECDPDNAQPNRPVNVSPANGATQVYLTPRLSGSEYVDQEDHTHATSQWQVSETSGNYSAPVIDRAKTGDNLVHFYLHEGLECGTTYFWRARYRDSEGAWSEWSTETSFTTTDCNPDPVTSNWDIVTVDSDDWSPGFGSTSLAFNPLGYPAISYCEADRALKYAYYNGNDWETTPVVSAGNPGSHNSLAFDSQGYPAIAFREYYEEDDSELKYAYYDGTVWQTVLVDTQRDVGRYASLAFDTEGNPTISHYDSTSGDVKYARHDGTQWDSQAVGYGANFGIGCSLAYDNQGAPAISYWNSGLNKQWSVLYIHYEPSPYSSVAWKASTVDTGFEFASRTSLAFSPDGYPAISYYDRANGELKYAKYDGTSWKIEIVDTFNLDSPTATYLSLAFDPSGNPGISYYEPINKDLKYAHSNGNQWNIQTVEAENDVGSDNSLAYDSQGRPAISYVDDTNWEMKIARSPYPEPELRIADITGFKKCMLTGQTVDNLVVVVENTGAPTDQPFRIGFYAGEQGKIDFTSGSVDLVGSVTVGESSDWKMDTWEFQAFACPNSWTKGKGEWQIAVYVDADEELMEADEGNNINTTSIIIDDDSDGDGIVDACDNCPDVSNMGQSDQDSDGIGDDCDTCPDIHNPGQNDMDGDGIGDECDNCPDAANANQLDTNSDGIGDVCEPLDLQIVTAAVTPSGDLVSGQTYSLSVEIQNNTERDCDSPFEVFFLADQEAQARNDEISFPVTEIITANGSKSFQWDFQIELEPGSYKTYIYVNYNREIEEFDFSNNYVDLGEKCVSGDSDGDGVPDCSDNCPDKINPGQGDSDSDGIGDECDFEDFSDGVDNDGNGLIDCADIQATSPGTNKVLYLATFTNVYTSVEGATVDFNISLGDELYFPYVDIYIDDTQWPGRLDLDEKGNASINLAGRADIQAIGDHSWTLKICTETIKSGNFTISGIPEICNNGVDDDHDGFIDCLDDECLENLMVSGSVKHAAGSRYDLTFLVTNNRLPVKGIDFTIDYGTSASGRTTDERGVITYDSWWGPAIQQDAWIWHAYAGSNEIAQGILPLQFVDLSNALKDVTGIVDIYSQTHTYQIDIDSSSTLPLTDDRYMWVATDANGEEKTGYFLVSNGSILPVKLSPVHWVDYEGKQYDIKIVILEEYDDPAQRLKDGDHYGVVIAELNPEGGIAGYVSDYEEAYKILTTWKLYKGCYGYYSIFDYTQLIRLRAQELQTRMGNFLDKYEETGGVRDIYNAVCQGLVAGCNTDLAKIEEIGSTLAIGYAQSVGTDLLRHTIVYAFRKTLAQSLSAAAISAASSPQAVLYTTAKGAVSLKSIALFGVQTALVIAIDRLVLKMGDFPQKAAEMKVLAEKAKDWADFCLDNSILMDWTNWDAVEQLKDSYLMLLIVSEFHYKAAQEFWEVCTKHPVGWLNSKDFDTALEEQKGNVKTVTGWKEEYFEEYFDKSSSEIVLGGSWLILGKDRI